MTMNRREFVTASVVAGGLVFTISLPGCRRFGQASRGETTELGAYVRFDPD